MGANQPMFRPRFTPPPIRPAAAASVLILVLAAACGPAPGPSGGGVPRGATPAFMLSDRDPVGFLLQFRDSLGLSDSLTFQLSQLKLRLFRRNQEVQLSMDSLMRGVRIDPRDARRDSTAVPDSVRVRIAPLRQRIRLQTAAAKDTAWAMLTELQRSRADSLQTRLRDQAGRRGEGREREGPGGGMEGRPGRP